MISSNSSPIHELRARVRSDPAPAHLDLLIVALGYEARSSHVATVFSESAARKIALAFDSSTVLSYSENEGLLLGLGFELLPMERDVGVQILEVLNSDATPGSVVGVDISSLTRLQIAQLVDALLHLPHENLRVVFLYAPAASGNWNDTPQPGPLTVANPIHPAFTSWVDDPVWPLAAIIGVGVEDNLALGVAEYLDVSLVHAFVPIGGDEAFERMNESANRDFFLASYLVRRSEYDIKNAFGLFARLESLIYGVSRESRVAVVPLGPKIFALCSLLAVSFSDRDATVWRFSSEGELAPQDRTAAGSIVSLVVDFPAI